MTRAILLALLGPLDASWLPPRREPAPRPPPVIYSAATVFLGGFPMRRQEQPEQPEATVTGDLSWLAGGGS